MVMPHSESEQPQEPEIGFKIPEQLREPAQAPAQESNSKLAAQESQQPEETERVAQEPEQPQEPEPAAVESAQAQKPEPDAQEPEQQHVHEPVAGPSNCVPSRGKQRSRKLSGSSYWVPSRVKQRITCASPLPNLQQRNPRRVRRTSPVQIRAADSTNSRPDPDYGIVILPDPDVVVTGLDVSRFYSTLLMLVSGC